MPRDPARIASLLCALKSERGAADIAQLLLESGLSAEDRLVQFYGDVASMYEGQPPLPAAARAAQAGLGEGDLILALGAATTYAEVCAAAEGVTSSAPTPFIVLKHGSWQSATEASPGVEAIDLSGSELSAIDLLPMIKGKSLLDMAARVNGVAAIDALVAAGHSVNAKEMAVDAMPTPRRSPLMMATQFDSADAIRALARHGADMKVVDESSSNSTCLTLAAEMNFAGSIRALVADGAPLQQKMSDGASPLHLACFNLSVEAAEALLELGASPGALNKQGAAPVHVLTGAADPYAHSPGGERAREQGGKAEVERRQLAILQLLRRAGADIDAPEGTHGVPASYCATEQGQLGLLRALLDAGANVNVRGNGQTLLHRAIANHHLDIIDELLARGCHVDGRGENRGGASPLFLAAGMGLDALVRRLHAGGADANTADVNGNTALHYATRLGKHEMLSLLLELGADLHAGDKQSANAAFCVMGSPTEGFPFSPEHEVCLRLLHARGLDFEAADVNGWTPVSFCAGTLADVRVLRLLHELGVPLNKATVMRKGRVTKQGTGEIWEDEAGRPLEAIPGQEEFSQTPAEIAASNGHVAVVLELYELGVIGELDLRRILFRRDPAEWKPAPGQEERFRASPLASVGLSSGDKPRFCSAINAVLEAVDRIWGVPGLLWGVRPQQAPPPAVITALKWLHETCNGGPMQWAGPLERVGDDDRAVIIRATAACMRRWPNDAHVQGYGCSSLHNCSSNGQLEEKAQLKVAALESGAAEVATAALCRFGGEEVEVAKYGCAVLWCHADGDDDCKDAAATGVDAALLTLSMHSANMATSKDVFHYCMGLLRALVERGLERHQVKVATSCAQALTICINSMGFSSMGFSSLRPTSDPNMIMALGSVLVVLIDDKRPAVKSALLVLVPILGAVLDSDQITPFGSQIEDVLLGVLGSILHGRTTPPQGCSASLFRRAAAKFLANKAMQSSIAQHVKEHPEALQNEEGWPEGGRPFGPLPIGVRVVLSRLVAKPELNGMTGTTVSFDATGQRYVVRLEDGTSVKLKPSNLSVADSADETDIDTNGAA